jgi:hypothetical protein
MDIGEPGVALPTANVHYCCFRNIIEVQAHGTRDTDQMVPDTTQYELFHANSGAECNSLKDSIYVLGRDDFCCGILLAEYGKPVGWADSMGGHTFCHLDWTK